MLMEEKKKSSLWVRLKAMGWLAFTFFLLKGLVWLAIFFGLGKWLKEGF